MKILYEFFEIVRNRLNYPEQDDIEDNTEFVPYPFIYDMDIFILYGYAHNIGDKLPQMNKEQIGNYARCLLREFKNLFSITFSNTIQITEKRIRIFNDQNKTSFTSYSLTEANEKGIVGEEYDDIYYFRTIFGEQKDDIDVYPLMTDCYSLIYILREIFREFGIDLKDEAQNMGLGIDYFEKWEAIEVRKKGRKSPDDYKNKEFTLPRQVLAIHTIISNILDKRYREIGNLKVAEFIQFLTGRYADSKAKDTNIYDLLLKEQDKSDESYNKDCDFVAKQFENIGLFEYAEMVKTGKK